MKIRKINESTSTTTMKIGFLDITFITNDKCNEQFVTIKNHTTKENLTHIFNKDGAYSSFVIKDSEICDLIKLCSKFTDYCTSYVSVSADTTYENMETIYQSIGENRKDHAPIINIKGDLIWYLTKDRLNPNNKK